MKIQRKIKDLFGRPNTAVLSVTVTTAVAFLTFFFIFKDNYNLVAIDKFYNDNILNTSGVLAGFILTFIGIIMGFNENSIIERLKLTGNIKLVYKVMINSIIFFILTILIFFTKQFFIYDSNLIITFNAIHTTITSFVLLIGLFSFLNALILFLFSVYILKKILYK